MTNLCIACNLPKDISEFDKNRNNVSGYRNICKLCRHEREYLPSAGVKKAKLRQRYETDPTFRDYVKTKATEQYYADRERKKVQSRKSKLKIHYGMTPEEYRAKSDAQGNVCVICKRKPEDADPRRKELCVDHDHATGKVRALLCHPCNVGLGHFYDSPELLQAAIDYLALW